MFVFVSFNSWLDYFTERNRLRIIIISATIIIWHISILKLKTILNALICQNTQTVNSHIWFKVHVGICRFQIWAYTHLYNTNIQKIFTRRQRPHAGMFISCDSHKFLLILFDVYCKTCAGKRAPPAEGRIDFLIIIKPFTSIYIFNGNCEYAYAKAYAILTHCIYNWKIPRAQNYP